MKKEYIDWNHLLLQVGEMLEKIKNHRSPITENITPELLETLSGLEEAVAFLQKMNQKSHELTHTNLDQLKEEIYDSAQISDRKKEEIKKSEIIAKDGRTLQLALANTMKKKRKSTKRNGKKKTTEAKARRKLFKPLGSDTNWIPM